MGARASQLEAGDNNRFYNLIASGDMAGVKEYLTLTGASVNACLHTTKYGRWITFPLHVAVDIEQDNYNHDLTKYLISVGSDLNVRDSDGFAPLHYAARRIKNTAAEALLEAGADVNLPSHSMIVDDGFRDISYTSNPNYLSFALHILLQKVYNVINEFYLNSSCHYLDLVKVLLCYGADCNLFDAYGPSPLHYAVRLDDITLAGLLIDAGADVNIKTNTEDAKTPIFHVSSPSMLKFLLSREADAETISMDGYTLFDWTINHNRSVTKYLVSELPELSQKKVLDRKPLVTAVEAFIIAERDKHLERNKFKSNQIAEEIIYLMIKAGCNPNTKLLMRQYEAPAIVFPRVAELFKSMETIASNPRSLLDLCTIRIRGILKKNISSAVESLPLPTKLKQTLTLVI